MTFRVDIVPSWYVTRDNFADCVLRRSHYNKLQLQPYCLLLPFAVHATRKAALTFSGTHAEFAEHKEDTAGEFCLCIAHEYNETENHHLCAGHALMR